VRFALRGLAVALLAVSCGRGLTGPGQANGEAGAIEQAGVDDAGPEERDPRMEDLWARAREGDADDLARLYDREGDVGLTERGALPAYRLIALQALGFAHDFTPLPWLAAVASSGTDAEAEAALESAKDIAARPLTARDPEDALELHEGCEKLLALATAKDRPRGRRIRAASVLRMLSLAGCTGLSTLPSDLDAK
jgi:hypothetical protein